MLILRGRRGALFYLDAQYVRDVLVGKLAARDVTDACPQPNLIRQWARDRFRIGDRAQCRLER